MSAPDLYSDDIYGGAANSGSQAVSSDGQSQEHQYHRQHSDTTQAALTSSAAGVSGNHQAEHELNNNSHSAYSYSYAQPHPNSYASSSAIASSSAAPSSVSEHSSRRHRDRSLSPAAARRADRSRSPQSHGHHTASVYSGDGHASVAGANGGYGTTSQSTDSLSMSEYVDYSNPVGNGQTGSNTSESHSDILSNKVFLGGIPRQCVEADLLNLGRTFGMVESVEIVRTKFGEQRGFGFIVFADNVHASKSVDRVLDASSEGRLTLLGKRIDAKRCIRKEAGVRRQRNEVPKNLGRTRKIFLGGLHEAIKDEDLRNYFIQFGQVEEATVMTEKGSSKSRGFGFVVFGSEEEVEKVLDGGYSQWHSIAGHRVEAKRATPQSECPNPRLVNRMRENAMQYQAQQHQSTSGGSAPASAYPSASGHTRQSSAMAPPPNAGYPYPVAAPNAFGEPSEYTYQYDAAAAAAQYYPHDGGRRSRSRERSRSRSPRRAHRSGSPRGDRRHSRFDDAQSSAQMYHQMMMQQAMMWQSMMAQQHMQAGRTPTPYYPPPFMQYPDRGYPYSAPPPAAARAARGHTPDRK